LGVRIHDLDKRSKKSIIISHLSLKKCKQQIDSYVEQGYGINLIPELGLFSDEGRRVWLEIFTNTIEELVRNRHEVIIIEKAGVIQT